MRRSLALLAILALSASACVGSSGPSPGGTTSTTASTGSSTPTTPSSTTTTVAATPDPLGQRRAAAAAQAYLDAWARLDFEEMERLVAVPPPDFVTVHEEWSDDLGVLGAAFDAGEGTFGPGEARFGFDATLRLEGFGDWVYESALTLIPAGEEWLVAWEAEVIHPEFESGASFQVTREWPDRAPILAFDGSTLVGDGLIKQIGVVPGRIEDLETLTAGLEEFAGISPDTVITEINRPGVQPDWFVPVGALDPDTWLEVRDDLLVLTGILVQDTTARLRPEPPFADHVLGFTGPITAEQLERWGPPYGPFDTVGRAGLELAFETRLAGTPRQELQIVNRFGRVLATVLEVEMVESQPVQTTLDPRVQRAVEAAIADREKPTAIVVIDAGTGEIRGTASRPLGEFDRALGGLYPPGSTFKIVTASALLGAGIVNPTDIVGCPGTVVIEGRTYRNSSERDFGDLEFAQAFAESCNTTFAVLSTQIDRSALRLAAERLGYNADYAIGVFSNGGQFPTPPDTAGTAAAAIGQGSVLVSPMHQASIAAAIAGGTWRPPTLVVREEPLQTEPLDPVVVQRLRDMMRLVVTDGTGQAADIEDLEVRAKTGSAEFTIDGDIETHAWYVGYSGDLAFAVIVEGGGSGGQVAGPIAADLLREFVDAGLLP